MFDDLTTLRAKMLHYLKKTVPMLRNVCTVDRKIHCTKKRPPGLLERDCPRKIYTIDTPDHLSSLGSTRLIWKNFGLQTCFAFRNPIGCDPVNNLC